MSGPRVRLASLSIAALAVALLAGCAGGPSEPEDTTLVLAQGYDAGSFANCGNGSFQCQAVYDQLLQSKTDLVHNPGLITEWSYNDDKTVLSVELRDDVTFTDGEPFDAEAVATNMEYLADGPNALFFVHLVKTEVTGEHSLDFILDEPDPWFVHRFGFVSPMVSPAALADPDRLLDHPVGSGPYVLDQEKTQFGVEYHYTKNEDYWDEEAYPWDTLVVRVIEDPVARLNALVSGEVDFAEIDASSGDSAEQEGLDIFKVAATWQGLYILDKEGTIVPALGDVRVRQAINMAFDRETLVETVLNGYGEASNQPFHPSWPEYDPELESAYPFDPEGARQLLAEAGYPDGFDLTIPIYPDDKWSPIVQQALTDIGIRVTLDQKADISDWYQSFMAGNYGVIIWGTTSLGTIDQRFAGEGSAFRPASLTWDVRDEKLNSLLAAMYEDLDDPAPQKEFGRYLFDLAVTPTWAHQYTVYGAQPGLVLDTDTDLPYRQLNEIHIAD